jgi:copper chaperone CopZ
MPPLNLDFSKISSVIKSQIPKETSNEAFSILKALYGYFNGLNLDEDIKENHPNFRDVKAVILAYFILNDVFLGKVVGDKEITEEVSQLEGVLQNLAGETNFKVNVDELKGNIDKMGLDSDKEKVIERSRKIFKEQLKQHLKPNDEFLTTTPCSPKNEAITGPVAPPTDVAQPAPEASMPPGSTPEVQA